MSKDELIAHINDSLTKYRDLFIFAKIDLKASITGTKSTMAMLQKSATWLKMFREHSDDVRELWYSAPKQYWQDVAANAKHLPELLTLRTRIKKLRTVIGQPPKLLKAYKGKVDGPKHIHDNTQT